MDCYDGIADGHLMYFEDVQDNGKLNAYIEMLTSILPNKLKNNLYRAYKAFIKKPDDISDECEEIMGECDEFVYDNEDEIIDILKKRAKEIQI